MRRSGYTKTWVIVTIDYMLSPYDDDEMEAYTVSRLVSTKAANTNTPEAIEILSVILSVIRIRKAHYVLASPIEIR